ncbi:hypothetical protein [Pelomonas sp. Root1444]|uniref:hypothetical protein n=1 Tax=Pelomonas sp. Root1444 TaxID=1736464 RepID=UPI0012FAC5E1|nr:hypothetical protein [Pelomonas sp. Root1444]
MHAPHQLLRGLTALMLLLCAGAAHAIGDSGGCTLDRIWIDTLKDGTPAALATQVSTRTERAWKTLAPRERKLLSSTPRALQEWQALQKNKLLNGSSVGCAEGVPIDRAILGGNLEVLRWLLQEGADPNGPSGLNTVFDRCPSAPSRRGGTFDREQTAALYKLLIAHGADMNGTQPELNFRAGNALTSCHSLDMLQLFLDMGMNRSPQHGDVRVLNAPLQSAVWAALSDPGHLDRVRVLAQGNANDVRGTEIESRLYRYCRYSARWAANCKLLEPLLRVSLGTWPAMAPIAGNTLPADAFSAHREACHFPEVAFVKDFEIAVVTRSRGIATGMTFPGASEEAREVQIIVNSPGKPVFLVLSAQTPRIWLIRHTAGTQIMAVVIHRELANKSAPQAVLGLDKKTLLANVHCQVDFTDDGHMDARDRRRQRNDSLDPFDRGLPFKTYGSTSAVDAIVVGEPMTASTWRSVSAAPTADPRALGLQDFRFAPKVMPTGR